jgi:hypothetical protein
MLLKIREESWICLRNSQSVNHLYMPMMDGMKRKFRHAVERKEALFDLQTDYTKNP